MENKRQKTELAEIFSRHAAGFMANHKLCPEQQKAFNDIIRCRTSETGGHINTCDSCGHTVQAYNSCRNRHCPKCQYIKKEQWVDKLAGNLPPVRHFHVVFTIPACLNKLFYMNQKICYGLLFKAAGQTLSQCAKNPKYLGAQPGAVAILHTWGQSLVYHPHIHMIVPAGGLSEDKAEWVPSGKTFFLPVKILSAVFRGVLCRLLKQAVESGDIALPEGTTGFDTIKDQCYKKNWVVYCERPFSSSDRIITYLGNYTHRVAISNNRILQDSDGKICFSYKDYKSGGLKKNMALDVDEFIRRFLQHVLPSGFYKIRYFGFMAMCNVQSKLMQCFELIGQTSFLPVLQGLSALEVWRHVSGKDPLCCPVCKTGKMKAQPLPVGGGVKPG